MPQPANEPVCRLIVVRHSDSLKCALEVCIKNDNVYVGYFDRAGNKIAHSSHHASGRKHFKKGGEYVYWTGGQNGKLEHMKFEKTPPKDVRDREEVDGMGWGIGSVGELPTVRQETGTIVCELPTETQIDILFLQPSIVGDEAKERTEVNGFPVVWRCRFRHGITVEIEAVAIVQR